MVAACGSRRVSPRSFHDAGEVELILGATHSVSRPGRTIGWIGLGALGLPTARAQRARLGGVGLRRDRARGLAPGGCEDRRRPAAVAARADEVVVCLMRDAGQVGRVLADRARSAPTRVWSGSS